MMLVAGCETPSLGPRFDVAVPPMEPATQLLETVFVHGPDLLVRVDVRTRSGGAALPRYWRLDDATGRLQPLLVAEGESLLALDESGGRPLALIKTEEGLALQDRVSGERQLLALPERDVPHAALTANSRHAFIIGDSAVIAVAADGTTWRTPRPRPSLQAPGLQLVGVLATETELLLAYDGGEWGGAVMALPLSSSGTRAAEAQEVVGARNVRALVRAADGSALVVCGVNRGVPYGALYQYQGRELMKLHEQAGGASVAPAMAWAGAASEPGGAVLLVCDDGLFRHVAPERLETVWAGRLALWYQNGDYEVGSYPTSLVMRGPALYVATRSTGLIEFRPRGTAYEPVRQITFQSATH